MRNSKIFIYLYIFLICAPLSPILAESFFPATLKNSENQDLIISPKEGEITVLEWFNKGCPFVQKFYSESFMQSLQEKYTTNNVKWYTINSTKSGHADFIQKEERIALRSEFKFKSTDVLYDEDGSFGKTIGAKTTPHIFIFKGHDLVFSGAVDDSPDSDSDPKAASNNIISSLDSLLKGELPTKTKTRPYGCSIKYAE